MPKGDFNPPRGGSSTGGSMEDMYQVGLSSLWLEIAATRVKAGDSVDVATAIADKFVAEYDRWIPSKTKPKFGV